RGLGLVGVEVRKLQRINAPERGDRMAAMADEKKVLTKNQRRRLKKKLEKKQQIEPQAAWEAPVKAEQPEQSNGSADAAPDVQVEYVSLDVTKELALPEDDPAYEEFMRIFKQFSSAEELCGQRDNNEEEKEGTESADEGEKGTEVVETEEERVLSKKQRKKIKRLSVAELKQLVEFPDVVEAHDVTSGDPRFLVYLKSYRNTVPVPRHWCHKRKYLQGKRGIEKAPFALPDFIAQTGIAEVRGASNEDDEKKKSKQKARDRMQPKMGRVDIDFQVLHDAFFKYQTKPKLSILGDLYYEGKEFEVKLQAKVPGQLSDELKRALGMVDGVPPPWLLNMQRYGPPPAYPNLKIPGLNAPIPEGASFGYHPGGWGKPPVDEHGQPLYGDVFAKPAESSGPATLEISRERWGELEELEEEPEEDEVDDNEATAEDMEMYFASTAAANQSGMDTPLTDGISSVASGLTTPGAVDLRKGARGTETPDVPQQLYTVLEQKDTSVGTSLYGSGHAYVVPGSTGEASGTRSTGRVRRRFEDVDPSEAAAMEEKEESKDGGDDDRKKKKAKTEKKKHKDFKF
ncbi:TPA: hypothetical protein N0F65_000074, partial [Lagenidium giganteum]